MDRARAVTGRRAPWIAAVALFLGGCAGATRTSAGIPPRAEPEGARALIGPRTLLIETRGQLDPAGSGRQDHVLRLGGELAQAAAEAIGGEGGTAQGAVTLKSIAAAALLTDSFELVDARKEPSGEVVMRLRQVWTQVPSEGELRVVPALTGVAAAFVVSILPLTMESMLAIKAQAGQPGATLQEVPPARIAHRFSLQLPDGFRARDLTAGSSLREEGITLERRLSNGPGPRVEGLLRVEIGPAPVPGARVEALMQRLPPAEREPATLKLEMAAESLLSSGRVREAFAETRRLVAAHDKEGFYRAKQAIVLMQAGLLEPARAEARQAVALSPQLDYAHQILAWTLECGPFGRAFSPGYDRASALEARRQQLALTGPTGRGAFQLAELLSRDESGRSMGASAPLEEIVRLTAGVEAFGARPAELQTEALLRLGRGAEAERVVRARLMDQLHQYYLLAAIAQARGPEAAVAELPALALSEEAGATPLIRAAYLLLRLEAYPLASALAAAAARISARLQDEADRLSRLRRAAERKPDPRPAVQTIQRLQQACVSPAPFKQLAPALIDPRSAEWRERDSAPERYQRICRAVLTAGSWPPAVWTVDLELTAELEVTGDAQVGYRVRPRSGAMPVSTFFLTADGRQPRFLGAGPQASSAEALRLASAGQTRAAGVWLGWTHELLDAIRAVGSPSPSAQAFALFAAGPPTDAALVRSTAAVIAAHQAPSAERAIPELKRALAGARESARRRLLAGALLRAQLKAGQSAEADQTGDLLGTLDDRDDVVRSLRAMAAVAAGKCPKAMTLAAGHSGGDVDLQTHRRMATIASACGAYPEAAEAARKAVAAESAAPSDQNTLAWNLCFSGRGGDEALAAARRAVQRTSRRSSSMLQTLALAAAQAGAIKESRAALFDALDRAPPGLPPVSESSAWLVVGATAEALDLPEEAVKAYQRVEKEGPPELLQTTSWALAQRRLAALGRTTVTRPR